ncbi:glycosyltransferase family 39 protein [Kitasatospora sp. DSM 101779]|uniref:glycosyltransferase family 39 protein n=1 Tax=Kitasatospora sp. DSM 101779 TaxID=2853165 RepID=UPI0021DB0367|nr:glycosyltransferase family 39 protein [Kitasatospora sp. DSM 101779]MCU7824288.1 glycosyltransferase family 39 protein [Kitasatospora sp. DSM 101779]
MTRPVHAAARGPVRTAPPEPTAARSRGNSRGARARSARLLWNPWLVPALVTFALGTYGASRPGMWQDELATWASASRSTRDLLGMLHNVDAVHGAYYLLIHEWIRAFGDSLTSMRMPGVLAVTGAAVCVALTGQRLFGPRSGLAAGLLFAVIPAVSRYAQEVRSYALVAGAVAAATLFLFRALEQPTWPRWLGYVSCLSAAGAFHLASLTFLSGHAVVVLLRWRDGRDARLPLRWLVSVTAAAASLLPLVLLGQRQLHRQLGWIERPTFAKTWRMWPELFYSTPASLVLLVLALLPLLQRRRRPAVEAALLAVLPLVVLWAVSHGEISYWLNRYLFFTVPAWAVLAGAGAAALRPRLLTVGALVLVTAVGVPDQRFVRQADSHSWYSYPMAVPYGGSPSTPDFMGAGAVIAQGRRPGDGIVYSRGPWFDHYLDAGVRYALPRSLDMRDVFLAESAAHRRDLWTLECSNSAKCLGDEPRLWVVTLGSVPERADRRLDGSDIKLIKPEIDALNQAYEVERIVQLRDVTVTLMVRR